MAVQPSDARRPAQTRPALAGADPELAALVDAEERLQADTLRLIPSENYVSAAVLEASGTVLQNKYSEGYPGKRYYEGQQVIDQVETLAVERAKALFGMDHANVQPYSGSPANLAVYMAFLEPGDTVLGMSLPMGGHLTHGWGVSATGTWFRGVRYGVRRDTGRIDLDEVRDLARAERPKLIFCGGTAVPRVIDFAGLRGDRPRGGRGAGGRCRPHRGADRRRRAPLARSVRRCRVHHHPQDPARAARRDAADPGRARQGR